MEVNPTDIALVVFFVALWWAGYYAWDRGNDA